MRTSFDRDYAGSGGIAYQGNRIDDQLKDVAQVIKLDLGTRTFTLDYGGWVDYVNPKNGSSESELFESEYLQKRGHHTSPTLGLVLPGYSGYTPMGIFSELPDPADAIFDSGFED